MIRHCRGDRIGKYRLRDYKNTGKRNRGKSKTECSCSASGQRAGHEDRRGRQDARFHSIVQKPPKTFSMFCANTMFRLVSTACGRSGLLADYAM